MFYWLEVYRSVSYPLFKFISRSSAVLIPFTTLARSDGISSSLCRWRLRACFRVNVATRRVGRRGLLFEGRPRGTVCSRQCRTLQKTFVATGMVPQRRTLPIALGSRRPHLAPSTVSLFLLFVHQRFVPPGRVAVAPRSPLRWLALSQSLRRSDPRLTNAHAQMM